MKLSLPHWLLALALLCCCGAALANDVDGPDDCTRPSRDFGDAPDGSLAYPGIMGFFPTCMAPGTPAGNQTFVCAAAEPPPGAANGFVRNENPAGAPPYWLGCSPAGGPPLGIDSEGEAKTNSTGAPTSVCGPNQPIDCIEVSWLNFGQDECYGDDDAGVAAAVSFTTCQSATISFRAYNCPGDRARRHAQHPGRLEPGRRLERQLPVPGAPTCANEWAVKNVTIVLPRAARASPRRASSPARTPAAGGCASRSPTTPCPTTSRGTARRASPAACWSAARPRTIR